MHAAGGAARPISLPFWAASGGGRFVRRTALRSPHQTARQGACRLVVAGDDLARDQDVAVSARALIKPPSATGQVVDDLGAVQGQAANIKATFTPMFGITAPGAAVTSAR